MSKKKRRQKGSLRHITINPSKQDVKSNNMDYFWFEAHPDYRSRIRPYIPGEFENIPVPDEVDLNTLQYVYVQHLGETQRARIPWTGDRLYLVSLVIAASVPDEDLDLALGAARQLAEHAELSRSGKMRKLDALCTPSQQEKYEKFIQDVFVGSKRYQMEEQ